MTEASIYTRIISSIHYNLTVSPEAECRLKDFVDQVVKVIEDKRFFTVIMTGDIDTQNLINTMFPLVKGKAMELAKHAQAEGIKAVHTFSSKSKHHYILTPSDIGLTLPLSEDKLVFITAVIEYLLSELLELAGYNAREAQREVIEVRDIDKVFKQDPELKEFVKHNKIVFKPCAKSETEKSDNITYEKLLRKFLWKDVILSKEAICTLDKFSRGFVKSVIQKGSGFLRDEDDEGIMSVIFPSYEDGDPLYLTEAARRHAEEAVVRYREGNLTPSEGIITIEDFHKVKKGMQVTKEKVVFVSGLLEYLLIQILSLAGNSSIERANKELGNGKKVDEEMQIETRDIDLVISYDEELKRVISHNNINYSGCKTEKKVTKKTEEKKGEKKTQQKVSPKVTKKKVSPKTPKKVPAKTENKTQNTRIKQKIVRLDIKPELEDNTKVALQTAAKKLELVGYSKLNKGPLIDLIAEEIANPSILVQYKKK